MYRPQFAAAIARADRHAMTHSIAPILNPIWFNIGDVRRGDLFTHWAQRLYALGFSDYKELFMDSFVPIDAGALYACMLNLHPLRGAVSYDSALDLIVWDVAPDLRLKISLYKDDGCISLCTPPNSQKFRHSNALFSMLRQKIYRHIPSLFSHDITHWHPAADEIWNEIQKINAGEMQFAVVRTPFSYRAIHIGAPRNFSSHRIIYLGEFLK